MSLIQPGHTSLNMPDISDNLRTVYRHVGKLEVDKRIDNDITKPVMPAYYNEIQKADDTDLVGGIKAKNIAIAIGEENRTTVDNALHLNGKSDDDFMSSTEGAHLTDRTNAAIQYYGDDIAEIRDELYQLKHELEKQGIVRNTNQHFGYNDIFRNGYKPYEWEALGVPSMDCPDRVTIIMAPDVVEKLDAGDYIAIYFKNAKKINVRQIKSISLDGETITLDEAIDSTYEITAANMIIYKSFGVSQNGNFYFAVNAETRIGDESIWTGLDDDTAYKFRRPITTEESSYGYSFRVPESKLGYLTKFNIHARAIGNPTLTCYIIDEQDIGYFKNPVYAEKLYINGDVDADGEPKMHFFAKSAPVTMDPTLGETVVSFDFFDANIESYPILTRKDTPMYRVRYVAIIIGTYIDQNNFAEVLFLRDMKIQGQNENADLQKNNMVYYYTEQTDTSNQSALTTDEELNKSDMYYGVTLKEVIENDMDPQNRGLYSALIECSYPQGISRARLTLRFAREGGIWNTTNPEPGIYGATTTHGSFDCECKPSGSIRSTVAMGINNAIRKPMELRATPSDLIQSPKLIVGNDMTTGTAAGVLIVPNDPIFVRPNDMVYRNAFIVSVKGKYYEYDPSAERYVAKYTKKIYLDPIAVIPDGIKYSKDVYSDRVVFEGDFTNEDGSPIFFNQLELQVYWEQSEFSDNESLRNKQMGIIHDLVFSTDRVAK